MIYSNGFDALRDRPVEVSEVISFRPNAAYERYLKMHKVVVGLHGAEQLEHIYETLSEETMPQYLTAAASAATEAALVRHDLPREHRHELLDGAVDCWQRAIEVQQVFNDKANFLTDNAGPYRAALSIACNPLFQDMVEGEVKEETMQAVFEDCLNIAQANVIQLGLAAIEGEIKAVSEHVGVGYECNALLAFNLKQSPTWFAVPATDRSDSGHHHRAQTHDIQVVHQRWGQLQSVTPVEVKSAATTKQRSRYSALVVRGKKHLSAVGHYLPHHTLEALTAVYDGTQTYDEESTAAVVASNMFDMVRQYQAGHELPDVASARTVTRFHDKGYVTAKYDFNPTAV